MSAPDVYVTEEKAIDDFLEEARQHGYQSIARAEALRFLLARKMEVPRAVLLYKGYQELLQQTGMRNMPTSWLLPELKAGKLLVGKHERDGPLVLGFLVRNHQPAEQQSQTIAAIVAVIDYICSREEVQRTGISFVMDFGGASMRQNIDYTLLTELAKLLQDKFPARVRKVILIDVPVTLRVIYYVMAVFLKPKLKGKIKMIPSEVVADYVDVAAVPRQISKGRSSFSPDSFTLQFMCETGRAPPPVPDQTPPNVRDRGQTSPPEDDCEEEDFDTLERYEPNSVKDLPPRPPQMSEYAIHKSQLPMHLRRLQEENVYLEEISLIEKMARSRQADLTTSASLSNRPRNRYSDVLALEHTRVCLMSDPNDYINANFITCGMGTTCTEFISTQGPLPKTIEHFWAMVWEQKSPSIVMVTNTVENGRVKCEQYWPEEGVTTTHGNLDVTNVKEKWSADGSFVMREITITDGESTHSVVHFHYTAWPDHGVPPTAVALLDLISAVNEHQQSLKDAGPVTVHCSAGIGRTGTYIAVDTCIKAMQETGWIDMVGTVDRMRTQRQGMVQTPQQYLFCYIALAQHCARCRQ
eukprot:comp21412_c0_seq1/m.29506 comp21412_c0_seq1/g.29506  ORF comp21412_c0_seq1/g.29506 comp21412_c0_seq1/m.29506 type:complete len:582 (-) comp21412_c0_seq1:258-2003(-)